MQTNSAFKFLKWILALAIVIIVNLLFHYAIATVYPKPDIQNFCPMQPVTYNDAQTCVGNGGQWTNYQLSPDQITTNIHTGQPLGSCDANYTCQKRFDSAQSIYNRNVFMVLVILSVVVLMVGVVIPVESLSIGFAGAGLVSLVIATFEYWSDANNILRLLILILALAFLIWIAVRKFHHKAHPAEHPKK